MKDAQWQVPVTRGAVRRRSGQLLGARTDHDARGTRVVVSESRDDGQTWTTLAAPLTRADEPDLGDGMFVDSPRHGLLYVCRRNRAPHTFAIDLHQSRDGGKTWTRHSTASTHTLSADRNSEPSRGLWAPFLCATPDGHLFCLYDDENLPFLQGFRGHQWLVGRFWNEKTKTWGEPVVVSRAHDPKHLSRDGMASVVALSKTRLLCAFESVDVAPPHPNVVRFVTSDDGGHTWSWTQSERGILYRPTKPSYMALAPWLTALPDGSLACVFCTDEDRDTPDRSGTPSPRLHMDIKLVRSHEAGKTWQAPELVFAGVHRNYLPGLVPLAKSRLLALWLNHGANALQGTIR